MTALYAKRPAHPHLRRPRRSDAPRDPDPPRRGRGDGQRAGRAVPGEPAGDLAPPEGARARRADRPQPGGAVAAEPDAGRPARRGDGVDAVPQADLGGPDGPARRAPAPERSNTMSDSTPAPAADQ